MNGGNRKMSNVFISGFPRAGTTMLHLIMNYFDDCDVYSDKERHPSDFLKLHSNKKYLVLKQPFGYYEDFPPPYNYISVQNDYNCKIISLVRDPRDVLVSVHASNPSIYWVPLEIVIRNCKEYLKHINDPNVLFIRYEDLVSNTIQELDKISTFLNVFYTNDFRDFYKHPDATLTKNNSLGILREINTDRVNNWKAEEHNERIKSVMSDELKMYIYKLGYEVN